MYYKRIYYILPMAVHCAQLAHSAVRFGENLHSFLDRGNYIALSKGNVQGAQFTVCWTDITLFQTFLHPLRHISEFFVALDRVIFIGVPGRDLKPGLSYGRPTCYSLSYATP
jgi:hypothetical protein